LQQALGKDASCGAPTKASIVSAMFAEPEKPGFCGGLNGA
jgi:hypothetical protein